MEQRKKKKRKKKRPLLKLTLILCTVAAVFFVMSLPYFDIKQITVEGNSLIDSTQIIEESEIKKGDNIFRLNKKQSKKMLAENPYFESVKISKKLPDKISITVVERVPKAVLPYGDRYVVLNGEGVVMGLKDSNPKLTKIMGITIKTMDSGQKVVTGQQESFNSSLEMIAMAEKNDLFFKSVSIGEKGKTLLNVYDNLYVEGNLEQIKKQIENGNLKGVLSDLYKKKIKRGTVLINGEKYCSFTPTFG